MAHALAQQPEYRLSQAAIAGLRTSLRGTLLQPSDAGYHEARSIWNGMIAREPALIARVSGASDVVSCVNFARENGLPLSIRGGGHNIAGAALCDRGLMIDMSLRRSVRVDPDRRIVRAEGGAIWGDVDHESQPFGLVVPGGIVSNTGVAGFTMGGGFGWTSRKYAYAADNLTSVDIVTADGERLQASETENADLFWALRGGGGNFGAVTSFEFRAHPHGPQALCGMIVYPMVQARDVAHQFRRITATAPDELCCLLILRIAPPAPFLPEELHGKAIAAIAVCWTGDPAAGQDVIRALKSFGKPAADTITVKPFIAHQTLLDSGQPFGRRYYWKSDFFADMRERLIDAMVEHAERITSPHSAALFMHMGGAPAQLDRGLNAVGFRTAQYVLNVQAAWENPQEDRRHIEWAREYWAAIHPFSSGTGYINFMTEDEGDTRVRAAYGNRLYERLAEIKARFDPGNLFHGAQNIPPR
ncbi:6-hydroxy-D-nicotine oxidase [Bradyrhizobium ivorense]|uniref:6-hydroxy-D-nicotine oxidase n=1 Tax=Bradyrhizobium ivorense TaxID=2511166 RepID=A0A508TY24_9BRAD|nr:FAD-binding oxidoreductase [Bradyrhizobium ivorense]VIO79012.1 6-hydroxy-D-nicotine oxidase [Bradyrhizobium ivorense]